MLVGAGHDAPRDYAALVEIVLASGALVVWCADAPPGFTGVQIGDVLYVNGSPALSDHQRRRILAHEWCHWLRRRARGECRRVRLYQGKDGRPAPDAAEGRDCEERIARAFERLF